jgi:hypothetical protein
VLRILLPQASALFVRRIRRSGARGSARPGSHWLPSRCSGRQSQASLRGWCAASWTNRNDGVEEDCGGRYESANSLARDVESYLHDQPAEVIAIGFAALRVLGMAVSAGQARRGHAGRSANAVQAQEKEHEANRKRDEAQRQRDEVKAFNDKLVAKEQERSGLRGSRCPMS